MDTKSRTRRNESTFSTLMPEQKSAMQNHCEYLEEGHGLTLREVQGTFFSHLRAPGNHFDYVGIATDPLMHRQNEEPPMVTTVCNRLGSSCMYLESRSIEALQFLHWKYYKP